MKEQRKSKQLTDEKFSEVLELIGVEGMSLRASLLSVGADRKAFYQYMELEAGSLDRFKKQAKEHEDDEKIEKERERRRNQYARACKLRADFLFDEVLEIADTQLQGTKTKTTKKMYKGKEVEETETETGDAIDHRRLQIDARKWAAGKMNPKKYGNTTQINGGVDDSGETKPVELNINIKKMTDEEFEEATR